MHEGVASDADTVNSPESAVADTVSPTAKGASDTVSSRIREDARSVGRAQRDGFDGGEGGCQQGETTWTYMEQERGFC